MVILVEHSDRCGYILVRPMMVAPIEKEPLRCRGPRIKFLLQSFKFLNDDMLIIRSEVTGAITILGKMVKQDSRTIRSDPPVFGGLLARFSAESAIDHRRVHPEAAKNLGHLGDMGELVRNVPDLHDSAERFPHTKSEEQVSYLRFSACEEFVVEDVPRPDEEFPFLNQLADFLPAIRTNLQVVHHNGHLAVQRVGSEFAVSPEELDQILDHIDKHCPEAVKREIPFAVPVRM